jgi:hypothetical protein
VRVRIDQAGASEESRVFRGSATGSLRRCAPNA